MSAPERVLLIKAKGGFGNRILSAIGGLVYADLSGRTPVIDWRDGAYAPPDVNAYPLLFDAPDARDPAEHDAETDVAPPNWRGLLAEQPATLISRFDPRRHSDPFIYRKYCVDLRRLERDARVAVYWSYVPKLARMRGLMARDARFRGRSLADVFHAYLATHFTPGRAVLDAVEKLAGPERRPLIGVHIRYTDRKTPLPAFERAIAAALAARPGASVFLATDNLEVERRFAARFPGVFTAPKWLPEGGARLHHNRAAPDMVKEAENALIDMWALARADLLIYSRHSTFSATSRLIGQLPQARVVDVDARNPIVRVKQLIQDYA